MSMTSWQWYTNTAERILGMESGYSRHSRPQQPTGTTLVRVNINTKHTTMTAEPNGTQPRGPNILAVRRLIMAAKDLRNSRSLLTM